MRCIFGLLLLSASLSAQSLTVTPGKPIMLDGKIVSEEWADAKTVQLGDFARLYVKQNNSDVLLAIEYLEADTFTVDVFLSQGDGKLYDLHSSAKLGERTLKNGRWSDEWTWWNNDRWVATVSRVDSWEKRTFLNQTVREFQISRSRFPGKQWKVSFEFMTQAQPAWTTTRFPAEAANASDKNWLTLILD